MNQAELEKAAQSRAELLSHDRDREHLGEGIYIVASHDGKVLLIIESEGLVAQTILMNPPTVKKLKKFLKYRWVN